MSDQVTSLSAPYPGPRNLITDITGLTVGNAENQACLTGVTVLLPDQPMRCAVDVRGGGPGTRETDLLAPHRTVERVDAICLSGGSAFGLDAASGVQQWLAAQGRGFQVADCHIPIVPAAILFDLLNGGKANWPDGKPPHYKLGQEACGKATKDFKLGNIGAGLGAQAGPLKGGLGSASFIDPLTGYHIGALVAVNSLGSVVMPENDCFWSWYLEQGDELGGQNPPICKPAIPIESYPKTNLRQNTTIGIVATDAPHSKAQLTQLANMAQTGLARSIRPVHAPMDGDTIFAISTAEESIAPISDAFLLTHLGSLMADCLSRAIMRGVYEAKSLGSVPDYQSLHG